MTLLIKAAKQQELDDLKAVCAFYNDDFDQEMLYAQHQTFGVHFECMNIMINQRRQHKADHL